MLLAVDVGYYEDLAVAAGVAFSDWGDAEPVDTWRLPIQPVAEYVSGSFYLRELPCVLEVFRQASQHHPIRAVIIDGFVWLDGDTAPGLGAHLYRALNEETQVIGVAKTSFATARPLELLRGGSRRPLFITAAGMAPAEARDCIANMHGEHRVPTLLKLVDGLSRDLRGLDT